jgi:tetratricopeptide (TPR) repeat protein
MIERLLAAEKALDQGMVDTAGRLYAQVAQADPRNAIALVGLAKVALREDRIDDARELAEQALAIDPDEAAAQRLLREVYAEVRPAPEPTPTPAALERPPQPTAPQVPIARNRSPLARLRRWLFGPRGGS